MRRPISAARSFQLVGFFFLGVNFDAMLKCYAQRVPPSPRASRRDAGGGGGMWGSP